MESIDAIKINMSNDQLFILNLCLAFLMFGIALDIKLSDFKRVVQKPKSPLVGLVSEYLLLPIIALILIFLFEPAPSLALGMILLSTCPGGSTSNYMVHLAKANTALSVTLTSITTLGAIVITPLVFMYLSGWVPGAENLQTSIYVEPKQMVKTIIQLILIPVSLGMFVSYKFPNFTQKIEKPVRYLSLLIFLSFVVFAVIGNWSKIKDFLHVVFLLVFLHNGLALATGYYFSKLNKLPENDARAISIETGIQNSGLGLILTLNFFSDLGGMAIIVAWWGVWHLITGFALAMFWSRRQLAGGS